MAIPDANGSVDLRAAGQLLVREIQLIPAAAVDANPDQMGDPQAIGHLRVVNRVSGVAWIIPAEARFLWTLRDQINDLLVAAGQRDHQETDKERGT